MQTGYDVDLHLQRVYAFMIFVAAGPTKEPMGQPSVDMGGCGVVVRGLGGSVCVCVGGGGGSEAGFERENCSRLDFYRNPESIVAVMIDGI